MKYSKILILIGILSIFIVRTYAAYTINTYNKSEDDEYISPIGGGYFTLQDGSKLFRFYRPLDDGMCNEPNLHLKILHVNGSLLPFNVQNLSIPKFNFCRLNTSPLSPDYIQITGLKGDTPNFYILYYNISDTDNTLPFGRFIAQVDMEGNILGENWLGQADFYNNNIVGRLGKFKYIYDSYYYIQLVDIHNPNLLSWQKFALAPINGLFCKEGSEETVSREYLSLQYDNPIFTFETIDNGLGFVYSKNYYSNSELLEPHICVYVNFFKPDINNFTDPFIIYQTSLPNITMKFAMCAADTMGMGYQCVLQLREITSVSTDGVHYNGTNLVLLVSFLSSGSVTSIKPILGDYATADLVIRNPLFYGGYLLMYANNAPNGLSIDGQIFDTNNSYYSQWDIPYSRPFVLPFPYVVIYNNVNNQFEFISNITSNNFTIVSSDVPKFINTDAHSLTLAAAKIDSIDPPNNTTISLGTDSTLKINYEVPVLLSVRNITIYRIDGNITRIRQTSSGQISELCSIDSNHQITINVLSSTFNVPNSEYHVYISPNFVKYDSTDEPISKLPHTSWILNTTDNNMEQYADSFSGSIRLTPDGTTMFKSNPINFTDELLQEISSILPVDPDRLSSEGTNQIDTSTRTEQLIIPLKIKSTTNLTKRNAENLHNDLNIMIKNKGFTEISMYPHTSLIDEIYGYKLKADIKDILMNNQGSIIAMLVVLLLIVTGFFWAKWRHKKGKNFMIFKIGLSIVDFVLDWLFIYKNSNDVKGLYVPSLTIFILSTVFNLVAALLLILYENFNHDKFNDWFKSNSIIASIATFLSATNIEVLNILSSRFAGLKMFSAVFSRRTESLIFWFSILNFIIEDIPQFCIQVIYKTRVVSYSIIPFLSLITSSLMIVLNLIGRLYNSIIQCQRDRRI